MTQTWTETDLAEMSEYLGILILMGTIHVLDYKLLWSTNKFLANGGVKDVMSVKRYEKLTQYLHVNEPEADSTDKLARVRPLLDSVLERCQ
ncbi:piggyBac transposable element-derived protein 2-like [Mytilus trossulus]|uniref:piggyBac transposable element-derived protein 2-like n=1 Tax=Mytilus trossulus TaxID=6551 RepID=UPI003004B518